MVDESRAVAEESYFRHAAKAESTAEGAADEYGLHYAQVHATLALAAVTRAHTLAMIELTKGV